MYHRLLHMISGSYRGLQLVSYAICTQHQQSNSLGIPMAKNKRYDHTVNWPEGTTRFQELIKNTSRAYCGCVLLTLMVPLNAMIKGIKLFGVLNILNASQHIKYRFEQRMHIERHLKDARTECKIQQNFLEILNSNTNRA